MPLKETYEKAKLGEQALVNAKAKEQGMSIAERELARAEREQAMAEQAAAEKEALARQAFQEGKKSAVEDLMTQGVAPAGAVIEAGSEAEQIGMQKGFQAGSQTGASIQQENDSRELAMQEDAARLAGEIDQLVIKAQQQGANDDQINQIVSGYISKNVPQEEQGVVIPMLKNIQQQRAEKQLNNGQVTPNPTMQQAPQQQVQSSKAQPRGVTPMAQALAQSVMQ